MSANFYINTHRKNKAGGGGFTLIETLVTLCLGVIVASILTVVTLRGLAVIQTTKQKERLHANAVFFFSTVSYWIKQGKSFAVPNASSIVITLSDGTTKTIMKNGGKVTLDAVAITTDDVLVQNISFTEMTNSFRVGLDVKTSDSGEQFLGTTTIATRKF